LPTGISQETAVQDTNYRYLGSCVALYKDPLVSASENHWDTASSSWTSGPGRADRLRRRIRTVMIGRALAPRQPEGSALCGAWAGATNGVPL
jgi:hypothetical protein